MQKQITSERTYTVAFRKHSSKGQYGFNVTVTGDKKTKVLREAKELLVEAQRYATEVYPVAKNEPEPEPEIEE